MGKKKKSQAFVLKPWCWYCEREFEDDKVLLQHQKSKHFKCQLCPRKLNTAGGLMVHSQQVHKCEPEPLTNTLPGRDGYDIEIFGMEGVPANAQAEWKARKESEAGTALLAAAAAAKRPRHSYNVIPEADLQTALAQHKMLMATRNKKAPVMPFPPFAGAPPPFPPGQVQPQIAHPLANKLLHRFPPAAAFPGMPPPTMVPGAVPLSASPGFRPPFPPEDISSIPVPSTSPYTPVSALNAGSKAAPLASSTRSINDGKPVEVQAPRDGIIWPDTSASPLEKRAQQPRYRYVSPSLDGNEFENSGVGKKRKAAADFL
nr:zinc finger protein [Cryptococcus depauperatus CBS 7841]